MDEETIGLTRLLLARLERISADSIWAHRASGVRGALLHMLNDMEANNTSKAEMLIRSGFQILEQVAAEYQQRTRLKA